MDFPPLIPTGVIEQGSYSSVKNHWSPVVGAFLQNEHNVSRNHSQLATGFRNKLKQHNVRFSF